MSDQASSDNAESSELHQDELVEALEPDLTEAQPLTVLAGFLSRARRDGYSRLYLTNTLDQYVEIADGDIAYSKRIPESASMFGGTCLWIRSSAPLQYTRITSSQVQAEFLKGSITANLRARSRVFRVGMARTAYIGGPASHNPACPNFTDWCESDVARYCPSAIGCLTADCGGDQSFFDCFTGDLCANY